jgi:hypothetical protein
VIEALASEGIQPYLAKSSRTRIEGKQGYTKHLVRFRAPHSLPIVGGVYPEIVLTNAHDTGSSFRVDMGLFRLVCKNGLVVNYGTMSSYRIRHVASTIENVLDAVYSVMDQFPKLSETVQIMQRQTLTQSQRIGFAQAAMGLRFEADKLPYAAEMLLQIRRDEDEGASLWNVYNTIQENLLRGQHFSRRGRWSTGARSTREVKSIDVDMQLNQGLWSLAEAYAGTA